MQNLVGAGGRGGEIVSAINAANRNRSKIGSSRSLIEQGMTEYGTLE